MYSLLNKESQKLIWFSHDNSYIGEVYSGEECEVLGLIPSEKAEFCFLEWLKNNDQQIELKNRSLMNCADFVYLSLFKAGLMTKKAIQTCYTDPVEDSYYGFPLKCFSNFDPKEGEGQLGDILIGYINGKPDHVMILSGRDPGGEWKGTGLWNMDEDVDWTLRYAPLESKLIRLQTFCEENGGQQLIFKRGALHEVCSRNFCYRVDSGQFGDDVGFKFRRI